MRYLLDTNIVSEPMKQKPNENVMNRLALDGIFSCSSATVWHELWYGIHLLQDGKRKQALAAYLNQLSNDQFHILPFCQNSAEWLAEERVRLKDNGIVPAKFDSEIAAVAFANQLILVTRNIDDFAIFQGLIVKNWFE